MPFRRALFSQILERVADAPVLLVLLDCTSNDRNSCFSQKNLREMKVGHADGKLACC